MTALEMLRRQPDYTRIVQERAWVRNLPIRSLHGSRIVLLGTGDIGTAFARRAKAFSPTLQVIAFTGSLKLDSPQSVFDDIIQITPEGTPLSVALNPSFAGARLTEAAAKIRYR